MLDVKCSRCDRAGQLSLSGLLLELGPAAPIRKAGRGSTRTAKNESRRVRRGVQPACADPVEAVPAARARVTMLHWRTPWRRRRRRLFSRGLRRRYLLAAAVLVT